MNILVTGGTGFIGSHTVVELMASGYNPIIVDDYRNSSQHIINQIEKITGKLPVSYAIDCCDYEKLKKVFEKEQPVGIIHFAAYKAVGESVQEPLKYYDNNIRSLVNVLRLMKEFEVKNIVFSSSCTVYGSAKVIPVTEETPTMKAESPYGNTKQIGEDILTDFYNSEKEVSISILRYFNPIGAHPSGLIGELPIGTPNNLIPYITQTAAGIRKSLTIFGSDYPTEDGSCIRDYIHVVDLATAHIKALEKLLSNPSTLAIFNVGTGNGTSVIKVVETFEAVTNQKLNYTFGPRRAGDVIEIYADTTKIEAQLNWKPKFELKEALRDAWNWQNNL